MRKENITQMYIHSAVLDIFNLFLFVNMLRKKLRLLSYQVMFGVATVKFAPYAFLNYLVPIISLVFILANYKIKKMDPVKVLTPQE